MKTHELQAGAEIPALPVTDLSNNPFARPDLEILVSGLEWICSPENNYPIRGTYG